MKDGVVEQTGGPLDLYDHPVNTFVAGFIGSPAMNLIAGNARRNGSGLEVSFANGDRVQMHDGAALHDGQPVLFGIRPEHCAVGTNSGLNVEVIVVEPTGADTQLYCRFMDQDVTATIRDRTNVRPGDRITLAPDSGRAHLFDTVSTRRLNSPA
jgi:multiple sugar transport system ATP-binding protein